MFFGLGFTYFSFSGVIAFCVSILAWEVCGPLSFIASEFEICKLSCASLG